MSVCYSFSFSFGRLEVDAFNLVLCEEIEDSMAMLRLCFFSRVPVNRLFVCRKKKRKSPNNKKMHKKDKLDAERMAREKKPERE